jgi:DNA primase
VGIVDEDIERVRAAVPIVDVVQQYVSLRRVGVRWVGLCPFHAEKTASFGVNEALGIYKCFGCNAGGDVISFVREIEHLDFVGAVELLANRAGIQLRYTSGGEGRDRHRRQVLLDAMANAVDWYHARLLDGPARRATTCGRAVWPGTSPASSSSAGPPTTGTPSSRASDCRATWLVTPAWPS